MQISTISRVEYFEAAHYLPNYNGKCHSLHGHSYAWEVFVTGPQTLPNGMIMDYVDLKTAMKEVMPDHMYLHYTGDDMSNDIVQILDKYDSKYMTFNVPTTAENMAPILGDLLEEYIHNELNMKDIKVVKSVLNETVNSRAVATYDQI